MITAAPLPEFADWHSADTAAIDRAATYVVETNDDVIEVWSGALLHARMRPEFVVGRAVRIARIEERI